MTLTDNLRNFSIISVILFQSTIGSD